MKDYYKTLEIDFGADILTVKKAYRKLALKYHPDKNKAPDASQKFIEITEAYEVLQDPVKKQEYDRLYQHYYKTKTQKNAPQPDYEQAYQNRRREWEDYGKQKAKEYSSIPFEEFARRLLKEISVGANYIPNIIAILFVGGGAVGMFTILPKAFDDNGGLGIFLLLMIFGLGYLAYRLFLVAQADYKEERKRKIINNKK